MCPEVFIKDKWTSNKAWITKKFCSRECYWKSKIGEKHSWGHKISAKLKGVPKSPEHRQRVIDAISKPRPNRRGEKHPRWKGDLVNYGSLHDWVARYRGSDKYCKECGENRVNKIYHWANISGEYKRDLNDWVRLCVPCHSKMDKNRDSMRKVWEKSGNEFIKIKVT